MTVTRAEIAQHNSRQSCWVAIHGAVYDVTGFLDEHPGGAKVLLRCAGRDATSDFDSVHSPELLAETLPATALRGHIDTAELAETVKEKADATKATAQIQAIANTPPPLNTLINLHDFEQVAQQYLTPNAWAYYASAADDEISKRNNARAYQKVALRPRILKKVASVDTSTSILGHKVALPVYMSAVGIAKYAHPEGECALAAAAGKEGLAQVLANGSSMPVEKVRASRVTEDQPLFFQLYVHRDISKSVEMVKRAVKIGVKGIWITVDSPVVGKREMDERMNLDVSATDSDAQGEGVAKIMASSISPVIDWDILDWLKDLTGDLPVVIKGIQCVEDAVLAYEHGVQGIVLSNHGGRSQDTAQAPLLTLLEIRKFAPHLLDGKMQIFIDGGIRRGTDVLKAIALGATAVGLGRPFLYSLSSGYGEKGVRRMVQILHQEIQANMTFLGATSLKDLKPEMINTSRLERELVGSVKLYVSLSSVNDNRIFLTTVRIGSFYAFILNRSDRVRLTVVARSNYDAVKANGIKINSENHGTHTFHPHKVVKSPAEATGPVDYVVCAHKAIDQEEVATKLAPVVDETRTTIVIIQNGVGNEEAFRKQFPKASILTCVTWVGANQSTPGIITHTKSEDMQIGLFPNPALNEETEHHRLQTFASLLTQGNTVFTVLNDMQRQRWEKVVWNAAWNSLTTLTNVDTQTWLRSSPDAEPYTRQLMREVIAIARACGVQLHEGLVDTLMERINAMPGIGSSMQTDFRSGRPMEIDVILGFPVRRARELGISAPYLESLYVVLRAVDGRLRAAL
ncbi:FMN-dependent dehydrogenase-domain-containing protein [Aspergillus stella-maris]|uniref:FMN-dependent dehydrogenase-domain-containing protein n=1 Tax=Aspergillus stella-maris TaxID=1810926 RepID=UPI003CCDB5DA